MSFKDKLYGSKNNIFQSKVWAEFQKKLEREVLEIEGNYFYKEHLVKDKYYLYSPKGPVSEISNAKAQISNEIQKTNDKNIVFARIEPGVSLGSHSKGNDPFREVTKSSILSQQHSPNQTLVLDLTKSEDEILKNMKSKHRYNIRLAEKKGAEIKKGISEKYIDNFYKLSLEVADRDKTFAPHPKEYYKKMASELGEKKNLQIFTAEYKGKTLSSVIILFYGDTAVYLHGASSSEHRELMPNHLVQWESIKEAKKRGCKYYDFWGVAVKRSGISDKQSGSVILNESEGSSDSSSLASQNDNIEWSVDEKHTWAGVTRFKLGFVKQGVTGEVVEFPGAYDLPINKFWYNGLSFINYIRKAVKK